MSESQLVPLTHSITLNSIKNSDLRIVISNGYLSTRVDKLSVYVNLAAYKYLLDEDVKRTTASLARKIAGKDLPVFFGGAKQPLLTVVSQSGEKLSQITRMSIQTSRIEWDFEKGVRIMVDKDMINFVAQEHVKAEIVNAVKKVSGPNLPVSFNF
jgi:hypothetical protein